MEIASFFRRVVVLTSKFFNVFHIFCFHEDASYENQRNDEKIPR